MKLIIVDEDPNTRIADLRKVEREINGNTVVIVGSTPNFPYGTIDPIQELSNLA